MTVERAVRLMAGVVVLASLALAHWVSPMWLWLTAFVGLNLFQAGMTGFFPVARLFKMGGMRPGEAFH